MAGRAAEYAAYAANVKRRQRRGLVLDGFKRANGNLEATSMWERVSGVEGALVVDGGKVRSTSATQSTYLINDGPEIDPEDHFVEAKFFGGSTTGWLIARYASETDYVGMQILALVPTLYTRIGGAFTVVGAAGAYTAGDMIRIACRGRSLELYQNGVLADTHELGAGVLTSGRVGLQARSATANPLLGDFAAGNLYPEW